VPVRGGRTRADEMSLQSGRPFDRARVAIDYDDKWIKVRRCTDSTLPEMVAFGGLRPELAPDARSVDPYNPAINAQTISRA
jgi:hypothetical protein